LKVGLIYNEPLPDRYGDMGEHEAVADVLEEVSAVEQALKELGYGVSRLGLVPPLDEARRDIHAMDVDVYFNLFEGFAGMPETEAKVAGMLAATGLPYTGSPPPALALALNKPMAKELLLTAGICTPRFQVLDAAGPVQFGLDFPCIVKPPGEDASHGITAESVVYDENALRRQAKLVCSSFGGSALVEEFIGGRELSSTVIGNHKPVMLSISEIVYSLPDGLPRILTFGAKWTPGDVYFAHTDPVCPAEVDPELRLQINDISVRSYRLFGCQGYARIDMRLDDSGNVYVIEANPNPDISLSAGAARQAAAIGLSYTGFIGKIIEFAMQTD
jgi:D-alanine-D-alanine ligase